MCVFAFKPTSVNQLLTKNKFFFLFILKFYLQILSGIVEILFQLTDNKI